MPASSDNEDYQSFIAIIPGICLVNLYERYGARLLEQNVRSFLQFSGKINKGIRDTIKKEPHMFLAFNNGLAATADHIELDEDNRYITKSLIFRLLMVDRQQRLFIIHSRKIKQIYLKFLFRQKFLLLNGLRSIVI